MILERMNLHPLGLEAPELGVLVGDGRGGGGP